MTASSVVPFSCGSINAELAAIRALDVSAGVDGRTHYYGLVSDGGFFMRGCATIAGSPDPTAVGSGPTGPASWGWDFDGSYGDWYGGHELGHTFGRLHPGFCGESNDDNNYPFNSGQLANSAGSYAGLDVGDIVWGRPLTALPGTLWHDVMTYCNRQWLSSYTYAAIRARLTAEDALGAGAGGGSGRPDERFPEGVELAAAAEVPRRRTLVSLVAQVNLTNSTGRIAFVNPVARGEVTSPDPTGPVRIRALDGKGKQVAEYRVAVKRFSREDSEQDDEALADVVLPMDPDTMAVEIYVNDHLADTFRASGDPVEVERPQIGQRAGGVELSWGGPDRGVERAGGASHNIQISEDRGRTWRTVAVGVREPSVGIPAEALPADRSVLIRIQASDGFRATETMIEWPARGEPSEPASAE